MKNKSFTSFILAACLFMSTAAGEPKNADKPIPFMALDFGSFRF